MIIYRDLISGEHYHKVEESGREGDEFASDAYPIKEVDGFSYEIDCQMITIKEGDVDIGANPSAEEQAEELDDTTERVNNVVHSFRLQSTSFDKKSYMTYIKGYLKALKARLQKAGKSDEEVSAFEKAAQVHFKKIIGNFKDWEFYTGESMNPDGMVALLNYREDGITPYFVLIKDGLEEYKVVINSDIIDKSDPLTTMPVDNIEDYTKMIWFRTNWIIY
ncbi:10158_t:CDS:2 [Paraglomus occultum]|uniref:Translationally-controlled tumor protein homolog n=1 Tax=Paraglomus occultum TaxID=144539 RepID=A0A9N8ZXB4_9GLOM|nr:10158_t:CDS:2 [Paraglomus occultum]